MLKPKRKITRKEIQRDPFLETVDKLEYNINKNRKIYINIAIGLITTLFSIFYGWYYANVYLGADFQNYPWKIIGIIYNFIGSIIIIYLKHQYYLKQHMLLQEL